MSRRSDWKQRRRLSVIDRDNELPTQTNSASGRAGSRRESASSVTLSAFEME